MDPHGAWKCTLEEAQNWLPWYLEWWLTNSLGKYVILQCAKDCFLKYAHLLLVICVCVCVGKNGTFRSGYSFKVMKNVAIDIAQDLVVRGPFIFWVSADATFGPKERISNIFNLIFFPY